MHCYKQIKLIHTMTRYFIKTSDGAKLLAPSVYSFRSVHQIKTKYISVSTVICDASVNIIEYLGKVKLFH